jgi:Secretion system C-terminal sorting domain
MTMQSIKKYLLISIFTSISATLLAQPSINSSIFPVAGDSSILIVDTLGVTNYGAGGANVIWNYSNLNAHYTVKRYYQIPDSTTYSSSYPSANLVRYDAGHTSYSFWNITNANATYYGYILTGISAQHFNNNSILYYNFPITYLQNYADSCIAFTMPGAITGNGIYYLNADGWGTLQLPNGSVSNCLRTNSTLYIGDSLAGSYSLTHEYSWYHNSYKEPLLSLVNIIVDGVQTFNYAIYNNLSGNTSAEEISIPNNSINIFPNPASDEVTITTDFEDSKIEIYDSKGKMCFSASIKNQKTIDLQNFNNGLYLINVKSEKGFIQRKILIIK